MRRLAIRHPPIAKHHIDYSEFEHHKNSPKLLVQQMELWRYEQRGQRVVLKKWEYPRQDLARQPTSQKLIGDEQNPSNNRYGRAQPSMKNWLF
jgi:hypothetical protein